jgi:hypothetical protein
MSTTSQTAAPAPSKSRAPNAASVQISAVAGGVFLAALSWTALVYLIVDTLPTVPNRWLFFLLLQIALSGTALPFVHLLHQRFDRPESPPVPYTILVRQSIWVGLFGVICLWLRIPRLLSLPMALIVLGALLMVEVLLRLRERTQWHPE